MCWSRAGGGLAKTAKGACTLAGTQLRRSWNSRGLAGLFPGPKGVPPPAWAAVGPPGRLLGGSGTHPGPRQLGVGVLRLLCGSPSSGPGGVWSGPCHGGLPRRPISQLEASPSELWGTQAQKTGRGYMPIPWLLPWGRLTLPRVKPRPWASCGRAALLHCLTCCCDCGESQGWLCWDGGGKTGA